jgi:glycosyltransferase involved in cell wall biosynthesis
MTKVEVVVVANGCTDGTEAYVKSLGSPFKLVSTPDPLGYTRAMNVGLSMAKGKYVVPFNNDINLLDNSWLDKLLQPFLADEKGEIGITGPGKKYWGHRPYLIFYCVMFRRQLLYEIGFLDEVFSPGAGEDTDFCMRLLNAGYKVVQVPRDDPLQEFATGFPIWHKGSSTVHEFPKWDETSRRNTKLLEERYDKTASSLGCKAMLEVFSGTYDVVNRPCKLMENPVRSSQFEWEFSKLMEVFLEVSPFSTVEIGTAHGGTLCHWIENSRPGATLVSVDHSRGPAELWREWADKAKVKLHVVNGDSTTMDTLLKVKKVAPVVDFLFLDGGNSYLNALADFTRYGPLVRKGGIVAIHNILCDKLSADRETWCLWEEIRSAGYKTKELYSSKYQGGGGIGIVYS